MKYVTLSLLLAAMLSLAGCGGGSGGGSTAEGGQSVATDATVALASRMINEATAEDCPTESHCEVWPVEELLVGGPTAPEDQDPVDL